MIDPAEHPTIAEIVDKLDHPIDYVRGVLGNMTAVWKKHGGAEVNIGRTGRFIAPHYRVGPATWYIDDLMAGNDVSSHFVAFNGRNHRQIEKWGREELHALSWSARSMLYDDVKDLLGKLRGYTPKT